MENMFSWLFQLGAIDQVGMEEIKENGDPEEYLWFTAYDYLKPSERHTLMMVYLFGPIPYQETDQILLDKGFLTKHNSFVLPTVATANYFRSIQVES